MPLLPARKSRAYEGPECPACHVTLPPEAIASGDRRCARCRKSFRAEAFPVADLRATGAQQLGMLPGADTPCAWHAGNAAETACGRCGSFMCGLCRVDADGRTLCAGCFDRLTSEGALASSVTQLKDHAGAARTMWIFGLLLLAMGPLLGSAAVWYGVKALKARKAAGETAELRSPRIAIVMGTIEIVLGSIFWVVMILAALA